LIRRYFLGAFRFAKMALADARNLTHANNNTLGIKSSSGRHSTPIYRDGRDKPAMTK
jgi:hypothetical protein